ncbi:undecaprenyl/decaprenyl-phosphate alpha-N-acetylglucosaminyl 1-phosphate transferase [candidate division KSB1 bacterium]|nr:undecaprenyl/decaprenyl-phosphate alpha-N-acetylglucosaminyl 1-phosphate transferase [candidate division KSB1 bacterium]
MRNILYLVVFCEALLLSVAIIPFIKKFALKWGIVDNPGERKVHKTPKPLMGGIGIFSGFFITVVANIVGFYLLFYSNFVQTHLQSVVKVFPQLHSVLPKLIIILGGGFLIHLLGIIDDIFKEKISYQPKFIAQFVIAAFVAVYGIRTHFMPGQIPDIIITSIWIVGITNGFNLLDNLDGLTAGVSIIASLILFVVAVLQGQIFFALMLAALAGASLGFLIFNFYPSKLFMGDSGSLFLGYMFGTLTVMGSYVVQSSASLIPIVMPLLILSIPLYDTFSVMFIRWREGRSLFLGDKCHFSHRLLDLGMGHRSVVIFIYLVCFCVGMTATLLPYVSIAGSIVILIQAVIIYVLITFLIMIGTRNTNNGK